MPSSVMTSSAAVVVSVAIQGLSRGLDADAVGGFSLLFRLQGFNFRGLVFSGFFGGDGLGDVGVEFFQKALAALDHVWRKSRFFRTGMASMAASRALESVTCERSKSVSSVKIWQRSRPREMLT